jgi:uncharacterized metal-binding protein
MGRGTASTFQLAEEKDMAGRCLCQPTEILIFPCSGGSNVGQIANQGAIELTQEKVARMFCLAGIGAHAGGILASTEAARRIVAIDGCTVQCAKKTLEHTGFKVSDSVVVTELGVEKNYEFDVCPEEVERVKGAVRDSLGGPA